MSDDPLQDYDYELPPDRIAQRPPPERRDARLLHWNRAGGYEDKFVSNLPSLLRAGDLLVANDTKVIRARLLGRLSSGGAAELLLLRPATPRDGTWWALARPGRRLKAGAEFVLPSGARVRILAEREDGARQIVSESTDDLAVLAELEGHIPLPPYIRREDDAADQTRYQTVYAAAEGSVAAPTAGLHFDDALLEEVRAGGAKFATLTLHVGLDTFRPITAEQLQAGRLHGEPFDIPASLMNDLRVTRAAGGRVISVGTTACRALESIPEDNMGALHAETTLLLRPGHQFRNVDVLMTNFHLPRSSLLLLVEAFAGNRWRKAYEHALRRGYRFYSYGDANWIERAP